MLKKKIHPSETPCFGSCLFEVPPTENPVSSDWSAHTRLTANKNRAAVLTQFLHAKLATWRKLWKNIWRGDVVWCHKVTEMKTELLTRHFRSSIFCGREELLLVQTFFSFQYVLHVQEHMEHSRKGRKWKRIIGLLLNFGSLDSEAAFDEFHYTFPSNILGEMRSVVYSCFSSVSSKVYCQTCLNLQIPTFSLDCDEWIMWTVHLPTMSLHHCLC